MPPTTPSGADTRTTATLFRQYRELEAIRGRLIKQGLLSGDASYDQVVATLRRIVPATGAT